MNKLTFYIGSVLLALIYWVGPSHQQIFYQNSTHGYNMTSLTNSNGDFRAYGFIGSDDNFYSVYFNFWVPNTRTCGGNDFKFYPFRYQSCYFRGGIFYQMGDPSNLEFSSNSQYVSLNYTIPLGTPCGMYDEGCSFYNYRFTEYVIYCDESVNTVENVNCSQTSKYGYQCAFRHSSACMTTLIPALPTYNITYNPIKLGGDSQIIFQDHKNSNSELSVYYNLTGLAYKTFNYSFIGLDGRAYEMFFSFGRNNTPECGDYNMTSRGFFYQSCQKGDYTYQLGDPYQVSYAINNQSGLVLNYTVNSFTAEYGCSIPGSNSRRSRSIRYNILCSYQDFSYSCNETSTSCEYECTIYSIYGCPVSVPLTNSTTGGYNTTGDYITTTGGYNTTTGGYSTTTTGGYNTTTGGYSTTTTTSTTSSSSTTTTSSSSTGSSSEEEPYFDCSWGSNGFVVSSNQNINCSSVGMTICITNDGSKVSVPSGDLNILTRGRIECQSNHIQCRSGHNSCSIAYPVFEINGLQLNTIQEDPLSSSAAPSVTSGAITITILTIFAFLF